MQTVRVLKILISGLVAASGLYVVIARSFSLLYAIGMIAMLLGSWSLGQLLRQNPDPSTASGEEQISEDTDKSGFPPTLSDSYVIGRTAKAFGIMFLAALVGLLGRDPYFGYNERYSLFVAIIMMSLGIWAASIVSSLVSRLHK